jgi:Flp pilus assembly protein TadG
MTVLRRSNSPHARHGGQALVEFSLALIPFVLILLGIFDLGRGIYMNNGVSEAAREIARATAVHPCDTSSCALGNSPETLAVITTQKGLIPGLGSPASSVTFACTTVSDVVVTGNPSCSGGTERLYIRVTVAVPFSVITPILSMVAPSTLQSTAHVQVP